MSAGAASAEPASDNADNRHERSSRRTEPWSLSEIGDRTGSTVLVTGANSGIGFEVALELAAHGALVVLGCRDPAKAQYAADRVYAIAPDVAVELLPLDLASQDSVRRAADRFCARHDRLDVLVNNAAVMAAPFALTEDGFDIQFATNHLGPFALTNLLMDTLTTTMGSRVVTVSSVVHRFGHLDLADGDRLQGLGRPQHRWLTYSDTKLSNLLFTAELDRRLRVAGAPTIAVGAHPGWSQTRLVANGASGGSWLWRKAGARVAGRVGQRPEAGALPILYAATAATVRGGDYIGPAGLAQLAGAPTAVSRARRAQRIDDARALWAISEELTGVRGIGDALSATGGPRPEGPATVHP